MFNLTEAMKPVSEMSDEELLDYSMLLFHSGRFLQGMRIGHELRVRGMAQHKKDAKGL